MSTTDDEISGQTDISELWATRVLKRSLFDADGGILGSIVDLILTPEISGNQLSLRGFVASVDRRQIFVHEGRVEAVDRDGVHLRGGTVDLRLFRRRTGEFLATEDLLGVSTSNGKISDIGFKASNLKSGKFSTSQISTTSGGRLWKKQVEITDWSLVADLFLIDQVSGDLARLRDLHKADAAEEIQSIPSERRAELTSALEASRLADLLEELPESEQAEILRNLELEDAIEVLGEMEIDDEIDLLKELDPDQRESFLSGMDPEQVAQIRALLRYSEDTAGGMMNPEAIILTPDATVAEAIARLRDTDLPPAISVRLFVTESPTQAPTGKYLGSVTLPRLLQEPPAHKVGDCINREEPTLRPSASENEVASLLARYDLLAVAVIDPLERLVGVITVDDVVIRLIERSTP